MVYYTNYKQIARIVLKSEDANQKYVLYNKTIGGTNTSVIGEYVFNVKLPTLNFNKKTKLAYERFDIVHQVGNSNNRNHEIGDVYIMNFSKPLNNFHTSQKQGLSIMTGDIAINTTLDNKDMIHNSFDITGNTGIFKDEPLRIFIDTKIRGDDNNDIKGCSVLDNWALILSVFEYEPEENKKDYVSDLATNYYRPT